MDKKIVQIDIEKLVPYARNARTHSDAQVAQIAASIREFGFNNPVLIKADNTIIAGHGRVLAARKLALPEVPCIVLDHLTDTQAKAYILADNKLALGAGWDDELLNLELEQLIEADFDVSLTGFSDDEISSITQSFHVDAATLPELDSGQKPDEKISFLFTEAGANEVRSIINMVAPQDAEITGEPNKNSAALLAALRRS